MNSMVVHFLSGKLLKGITHDFNKTRPVFHVQTAENPARPVEVLVKLVKAIFFVQKIEGKREAGMGHLTEGPPRAGYGRHAKVEMTDGEVLTGFVEAFRREDPLFLLIPEKQDNNDRVYLNPQGVKEFTWQT